MTHIRERWGSRIGFVLTTAGAAVGLGNIQRFPYMAAQNGGAIFLFLYLLCTVFISLPLMLVEFAIGRQTQKNPVAAIQTIRPGSRWRFVGYLGICTAFFILCYYVVAVGWTVGYAAQMVYGTAMSFDDFAKNPFYVLAGITFAQLVTIAIVKSGLNNGIERWNKIFMPLLAIILFLLVLRSITLPNSWEGIKFYLYPDLSELNFRVAVLALSQSFFSLCIGEAVLVTYGSYASKTENMVGSAYYVGLCNALAAVLSGLVIFPAVFSYGQVPNQGVGLIYNVMPKIFLKMPLGSLIGFGFFVLVAFAGLTTCIALLEMPVAYFTQSKGWSRTRATWTVGLSAWVLSIPCALSRGANSMLSRPHIDIFKAQGVYEIMDVAWGNLGMVLGGLLLSIFTVWIWGIDKALKELRLGCDHFNLSGVIWTYLVKYVAPIAIALIFFGLFF